MQPKELAEKVYQDIQQAPETWKGLELEIKNVFRNLFLNNLKEISELKNEDEFYTFLSLLLDKLIILPQPWESFDNLAIKIFLKNIIDRILDQYAGKDWYERLAELVKKT